jgi:hypothetical protein
MEIDSRRIAIDIGIGIQENKGNEPQLELQSDSITNLKATKVLEVSMEKVEDSPPRSQPKGAPSEAIESIIKLPHDLVG